MGENLDSTMQAHTARLSKTRNSLERIKYQIDNLTVTASIDGTLRKCRSNSASRSRSARTSARSRVTTA